MEPEFFYSKFTADSTLAAKFCAACGNGFVSMHEKKRHSCIKNIKRSEGRFVCTECPTECYDIQDMWDHIDKSTNHTGKSCNGSRTVIMHKGNTDQSCCPRCNKGFTNSKSCDTHYAIYVL